MYFTETQVESETQEMSSALVVINERSGEGHSRRTEIEQALAEAGVSGRIVKLDRRLSLENLVRSAGPGSIVVAAGGDGTVNAVASAVLAANPSVVLGVLPVGTLNHFAKDLKLPLTVEEAAKVIAAGVTRPVDVGEVNGRLFVNNSSIGFYPGMVLQRERLKKVGWNKWISLIVASFRAFMRFRHIHVSVTLPDGECLVRTTPFVFVGNNEYSMEGTSAGTRERLDTGRLYLYMAPGATRHSLLLLTLAALRHKARESPAFESVCVEECTVDHHRRVAHVALDGEIVRMKGPLHYRVRPAALQVLTP